jgi:hypothetical protein
MVCSHNAIASMARTAKGLPVFIDEVILSKVDATTPPYMTRTAWVNHLLDRAIAQLASDPYVSAGAAADA